MQPEQTAAERILAAIERKRQFLQRPLVVGLDGGSGSGKSTLAAKLSGLIDLALVETDGFYQTKIPETEWLSRIPEERLKFVFDWDRIRHEALEPLRESRPAKFHAFDFGYGLTEAGTYRLSQALTVVEPSPTILIEGAYSTSPALNDLIDISVLLNVPREVRHRRVELRDGDPEFLPNWHRIWDDVEEYYFTQIRPPESFDLVL